MHTINNNSVLLNIEGGQPNTQSSAQYDLSYILGWIITGAWELSLFSTSHYSLAFK